MNEQNKSVTPLPPLQSDAIKNSELILDGEKAEFYTGDLLINPELTDSDAYSHILVFMVYFEGEEILVGSSPYEMNYFEGKGYVLQGFDKEVFRKYIDHEITAYSYLSWLFGFNHPLHYITEEIKFTVRSE